MKKIIIVFLLALSSITYADKVSKMSQGEVYLTEHCLNGYAFAVAYSGTKQNYVTVAVTQIMEKTASNLSRPPQPKQCKK